MRGLDPELKSARFANYVTKLRKEILRLSRACGVCHPALITSDHLEIINDRFQSSKVSDLFAFDESWGQPSAEDRVIIERLMAHPSQSVPHQHRAPKIKDTAAVPHKSTDSGTTKSGVERQKI